MQYRVTIDRVYWLTHWGRVTHICVGKLTIIGSDNGLSPERRQAIIWTNAGILLIGPLGTNFSEILIEIQIFSYMKMHLKMSFAKWRPFCLGLNVLTLWGWDRMDIYLADDIFNHIFLNENRCVLGQISHLVSANCSKTIAWNVKKMRSIVAILKNAQAVPDSSELSSLKPYGSVYTPWVDSGVLSREYKTESDVFNAR